MKEEERIRSSFDSNELDILADSVRAWNLDHTRSHVEVMDGLELLTKINKLRGTYVE